MLVLAREWLRDSGYGLQSVEGETADGSVRLLLAGNGALPPVDRLEQQLRGLLSGRRLEVKVLQSSGFSLNPSRP